MSDTPAAGSDLPDLSRCEHEPIHIPGAVQPHGALLVLDADGRVLQASVSVDVVLGLPVEDCLGRHWGELFAWNGAEPSLEEDDAATGPQAVSVVGRTTSSVYQAVLHRCDASTRLLEIEPRPAHAHEGAVQAAYDLMQRLDRIIGLDELMQLAARRARTILGYDRVMIYRFDADYNGEVIAESVVEPYTPFVGLNYPASDIPAQARALYLSTRVRGIADVRYRPSAIVPALDPRNGHPVDLSHVALRSVSPVHIEYLCNMGVGATLVASIVVAGRLWGLVSCHHYAPRFADAHLRRAAELIGRALGDRVATIESARAGREQAAIAALRERLITSFADAPSIDATLLADSAPELMDIVDADGIALFDGDEVIAHGRVPPAESLLRLRRELLAIDAARPPSAWAGIVHTDRLGEDYPELAELADVAAGALLIPLDPLQRSAVLWLREERIRTVRWGGNPHLAKLPDAPGARLSPRKSFEEWQETVRGTARPWRGEELDAAQNLRLLVEMIERKRLQQLAMTFGDIGAGLDRGALLAAVDGDGAPGRILFCSEAFRERLDPVPSTDARAWFDARRLAELAASPPRRPQAVKIACRGGDVPLSAMRLEGRSAAEPGYWLLLLRD